MNDRRSIDLHPDKTIGAALEELREAGVRSAALEDKGQIVGHLAIRKLPEEDGHESNLVTPGVDYADLDAELLLAKKIQQRLLPRSTPSIPGLSVYGTLISATVVGGDYWSVKYYRQDDRVTLKLADVTGHGIAAALLVPAVKFISGGFYRGAPGPEWVMERTNHVLVKETPVEILVSMVYAWYYPETHRLSVVNAGRRPAFLTRGDTILDIPTTGPVLGLIETDYDSVEYEMTHLTQPSYSGA